MLTWLTYNLGTIMVTVLLVLIVAMIIRSMIKDKKQGKTTCGGNCGACAMCEYCHKKPTVSK